MQQRRAFLGIWFVIGALLLGAVAVVAQPVEQREIEPAKSSAQFTIQHIFVDRVTGTIPIQSGSVELASGQLIPTALSAVLDPNKMNTGDRDRDGSLESPDYFDTKQFPTWTYVSTKVTATGPTSFGVDGTLTMHGVSQPAHLDVTVSGDASHPIYRAFAHVDRRIWQMKGTRLDPVIGNVADITLTVALK